jgi:hypothetical protein
LKEKKMKGALEQERLQLQRELEEVSLLKAQLLQ